MIGSRSTRSACRSSAISREAIALYRAKLRPGGALVFNVSNRYLTLRPILGRLAQDAGLVSRGCADRSNGPQTYGRFDSEWVIMAQRDEDFGAVLRTKGHVWEPIVPRPDTPL